jgi:hypothetical protein
MKFKNSMLASVYFAPIILFIAAILTFTVYVFTNRSDMTSALLLLIGFMLLITGILLLTLADKTPLPAKLTELLPIAGSLNLATLLADLGVTSNTIHRHLTDGDYIQINPVSGGLIPELPAGMTFITTEDWEGVQYHSLAEPLMRQLKSADKLQVPTDNQELLATCIAEVMKDTLSLAEKVTVDRNDKSVIVTLDGFSLKKTCTYLQGESPKCCTMVGCPVCSLMGAILAEGERCDVQSDSALRNGSTLTVSYSLMKQQ